MCVRAKIKIILCSRLKLTGVRSAYGRVFIPSKDPELKNLLEFTGSKN